MQFPLHNESQHSNMERDHTTISLGRYQLNVSIHQPHNQCFLVHSWVIWSSSHFLARNENQGSERDWKAISDEIEFISLKKSICNNYIQ